MLLLSFVLHLLSHGCRLLLCSRRCCPGQYCSVYAQWVGEDHCGDYAPPSPHHSLPHHHQPSSTVLWRSIQYPIKWVIILRHLVLIKIISFLDFNWKRVALRTFSTFVLLFIAETVPSFGSILNLVGGSTVTLLTFVFPPYFYMRIADASLERKDWVQRYQTWIKFLNHSCYCYLICLLHTAGIL